jgi:hypothetical protein
MREYGIYLFKLKRGFFEGLEVVVNASFCLIKAQ